jgi:hypothetical protein
MPITRPRAGLAEELAPIELPAVGGTVVRLGDLWATGPAVLVHLRHFG